MINLTLLIPDKPDEERYAVANAWLDSGGHVSRVARFWDPPVVDASKVRIYGNDTFCLVLAEKLHLKLISPPDDFMLQVEKKWVKRSISVVMLSEKENLSYPCFIKPVIPKLFKAQVYYSVEELDHETRGLEAQIELVLSEIVQIKSEARFFILDAQVMTGSIYEGESSLTDAKLFVAQFLKESTTPLPATYVLDLGLSKNEEWFVLEANSTWGAGLNGCCPEKAAVCLAYASGLA